ncbi:MAG: multifunctional SOS repair factor [Parcubacteria group bacterium Gr01-1014_44]|nr:MAG: multifunctional SOS repair factor [Parcubacteria group bacterium Gr01-1014_44]
MAKVKMESKNDSVELAVKEIQQKYGDGSIMRLGDARKVDVDVIPTGSISLDLALGVGGVPRGRVIEIYGPESSGKTTLALHLVSEVQKMGGVAAYVDAEHALDPDYAKKIGVKIGDLLISQPDHGEQALEIVETLVRSGGVSLVVIDSVAALTPRAEIEGEMDQQHMGLQARLMSHALRKLTAIVAKTNTTVVFINQIRHKIGVMFGNPETTTGGLALKFYSSVRLEIRRAAQIQSGEKIIGNRTKVKVVKNKVAAPFKVAEFDILYNEGISKMADLVNTGVLLGVVNKAGSWYNFGEQKLGQGMEGSRLFLKENPKVEKEILGAIRKAVAVQEV